MARNSSLEGRLLAVLSQQLNRRGVNRVFTAAVLLLGAAVAIPVAMLRAADTDWNPPRAAHVGTNEFSTFCDHDGKTAAFIIAYRGDFGSSSTYDSNPQTRTWTSTGTLTVKESGVAFSFHRAHTAPDKLTITVAPADARDLSKPASAPGEPGKREYDLTKGWVFLKRLVSRRRARFSTSGSWCRMCRTAQFISALPPQRRVHVCWSEKVASPWQRSTTRSQFALTSCSSPARSQSCGCFLSARRDGRWQPRVWIWPFPRSRKSKPRRRAHGGERWRRRDGDDRAGWRCVASEINKENLA